MNDNLQKLHQLTASLTDKDRELREQKETYQSLVELLPEVVIVHKNAIITFINDYGLQVFGFQNKDRVIGHSIYEFIHKDHINKAKALLRTVNGVCKQGDFLEIKLIREDGSTLIGEAGASTVIWKGEPAVQTVIRDITNLRRMENELLEYKYHSGKIHSINMPIETSYKISDGWMMEKIDYTTERDIYNVTAERGADLKKHFHKQKEFIEIIKGELIVFLEDETVFLKSGDTLEIEPFSDHKITAMKNTEMRVTFAPPLSEKE